MHCLRRAGDKNPTDIPETQGTTPPADQKIRSFEKWYCAVEEVDEWDTEVVSFAIILSNSQLASQLRHVSNIFAFGVPEVRYMVIIYVYDHKV